MKKDIIRILRVIEYVGEREEIEKLVEESIQGTKRFTRNFPIKITAVTLGAFPESLAKEEEK